MKGNTRRSKYKGILLTLALIMGLLTGCGSNPANEAGVTVEPTVTAESTVTAAPSAEPTQEAAPAEEASDPEQEPAEGTPAATEAPETVKASDKGYDAFDNLDAASITKEMGAGWNLGNALEANLDGKPSETGWGNPAITPNMIRLVKDAGFSTIRIPVSYLSYIGDKESGYAIDEKWMERVNQVVDYAIDAGFYVIINVHGDGYDTVTGGWLLPGQADQTEILEKYAAVWKQIAERYAEYDEHLIFESMNEIGANNTCNAKLYANINAYNQTFLDTIRQTGGNNDRRWVLIPGYNTNIDKTTDGSGFEIPEDTYLSADVPSGEHRIMISVHYYDPWSFCGGDNDEATQWGVNADSTKTANWGDEAYMEQQFIKMYDAFSSQGYPVIIGEYGSVDKSMADEENTAYRIYFAAKVCEKAIRYGLVPVYWDNGWNGNHGFALFNRNYTTVSQPEIIEAIMAAFREDGAGDTSADGTATGIRLSETELSLAAAAENVQLTAELTPADCTDPVSWSSSNDAVATVSRDGVVHPNGAGTAVITASCNGMTAECMVTVESATATAVNLYVLETNGWQTAAGENAVVIDKDGTYTLEMKVSDTVLANIGSFYIKDAQVQAAVLNRSLMTSGKITVDSITLNGVELTMRATANKKNAISGGNFDVCMLNRWAVGSEMFEEYTMTEDGDYNFSGVEISAVNTITITFTMTDVAY